MTRTKVAEFAPASPHIAIHVAERGTRTLPRSLRCEIGQNVRFSTEGLESYFFARWEPAAYDALLVAAAVEFADITQRRSAYKWGREFELRIPVHDPDRWNDPRLSTPLHDVLSFLTGDRWTIRFHARKKPELSPQQSVLTLGTGVKAVIPFSNGLDSRAVAGLLAREMGDGLVRVRLGSSAPDGEALSRERHPFTAVPYKVSMPKEARSESTARSRGFKFALISGIAAYLADAGSIIVPESGQGAFGPMLVTVGQSYEDYRSHPLFTNRMERFLQALFGHRVQYNFPQIWHTKSETLRQFVAECADPSWSSTWSCWQQNRHVSVDGKKRQCGVCAACMLRRMSIHAAGLTEPSERYVWEDLSASDFAAGAAQSFDKKKITGRLRQYAIAGVLHLDHLAGLLKSNANRHALDLAAFQLGGALGLPEPDARARLDRLLKQHTCEWEGFVRSLGAKSFVAQWAVSAQS
jgi:7-cyano-7-deazaguanine synthase in queuosine biosynthesis